MIEKMQDKSSYYLRFHVLHRLLHIIILINFTGLAITGFALNLSHYQWTRFIVYLVGGASTAGSFHRLFGIILYLGVVIHFLWLFYYKAVLKGRLTGPDSLVPSAKDIADLYQNLRYIFGKGTPPLFDRFSYLQKVDYWAVMIGMQSMGITGLLMWFPEFFSRILPGHWINVANHFHFHEAILAVLYIGFVHMSDTHLAPEVFPMEKSIFSGKISEEKLKKEHPEEWKRIQSKKAMNE
jgi:cytochrome b subunit of formate dehydrogenase